MLVRLLLLFVHYLFIKTVLRVSAGMNGLTLECVRHSSHLSSVSSTYHTFEITLKLSNLIYKEIDSSEQNFSFLKFSKYSSSKKDIKKIVRTFLGATGRQV